MASETSPTQKDTDPFGLAEPLLEELKEKAVAAKERAYCRCCSSLYLVYLSSLFVLLLNGKSPVQSKTIHKIYSGLGGMSN